MTDRRCSECGREERPRHFRRGLCNACYLRAYKAGALPTAPQRTPYQRIDRKIIALPNGCWLWTGNRWGLYGTVWMHGRNALVHRVQYARYFGPIPDGLTIDHLCREEICVNPWHMEPVTKAENTLRSPFTRGSINKRKTHCPVGHPYTAENTYISRASGRLCRTCNLERARLRYLADRESVTA